MSKIRISVVTPSFNQVEFLEHTLRSVLDQKYENLEYLVIDGGSTDGSVEIIRNYAPQLSYWLSEPDSGHGNALNKGFRRSTGEIMAWLNSDDLYFPWTLATVAEIFSLHPEIDWVTSHANAIIDRKGRILAAGRNYNNKHGYLMKRCGVQQESTFWRRSLWDRAGGYIDEEYNLMVDAELWTRFFHNAPLYHVECLLGAFRRWGGNRSISHRQQLQNDIRRCVAAMERSSDPDTLSDLAKIRFLHRIPRCIRQLVTEKTMRWFMPALGAKIAYDALASTPSGWRHRTVPFFKFDL